MWFPPASDLIGYLTILPPSSKVTVSFLPSTLMITSPVALMLLTVMLTYRVSPTLMESSDSMLIVAFAFDTTKSSVAVTLL